MEGRTDGDHELEPFGNGGEGGGRGPRVERRGIDPLDVIEEQLGDQRQIVADRFAALRETSHIVPGRLHPFILDVPQPTAEDGEPVAVPHGTAGARVEGLESRLTGSRVEGLESRWRASLDPRPSTLDSCLPVP